MCHDVDEGDLHAAAYQIALNQSHRNLSAPDSSTQWDACRLDSNPWVGGDPVSYEGPCKASSSTEGQSSWAEVEGVPWSQVGKEQAV